MCAAGAAFCTPTAGAVGAAGATELDAGLIAGVASAFGGDCGLDPLCEFGALPASGAEPTFAVCFVSGFFAPLSDACCEAKYSPPAISKKPITAIYQSLSLFHIVLLQQHAVNR